MAKVQVTNSKNAICSECETKCKPEFWSGETDIGDGTKHNFGDEWKSDCCSADIEDVCGGEWVPEYEEV